MEGGDWTQDLGSVCLMPDSALCAEDRINRVLLKIADTPEGGRLLGILQPVWIKAVESDMRLRWLGEMIRKGLVVKEISNFGGNINDQLRAESSKEEELGRESLISLMRVKYKDEKRYHRECIHVKEQIKDWLRKHNSRGRLKTILEKLKNRENKRRGELKVKYREKTTHLEKKREEEQMEKMEIVPTGLEAYSECKVFHKSEMEKIIPEKIETKLIGKVKMDEDEMSVIKLNPKFAIMKKLKKIDMEQDIEVCLGKLRYEIRKIENLIKELEVEETEFGIGSQCKRRKLNNTLTPEEEDEESMKDAKERQIYDPITRVFNYSKRRVTDLPENNRVQLPKEVSPKQENELGMLREIVMKEFVDYKREIEEDEIKKGIPEEKRHNQEGANLTKIEKNGIKKLKKRIQNKEIIILKTDKSGKLTAIERDKYL